MTTSVRSRVLTPGVVEQLARFGEIERVGHDQVLAVAERGRAVEGRRDRLRHAEEGGLDQVDAVQRVRQRLAHLFLVERRLGGVDHHVEDRAGVVVDVDGVVGVRLQRRDVREAGQQDAVERARLQIRQQRLGLAQPLEHELVQVGQVLVPVVGELREARELLRHPLGHLERAGANRQLLDELRVGLVVDADQEPVVQDVGDVRHRRREAHLDGRRVRRGHVLDRRP